MQYDIKDLILFFEIYGFLGFMLESSYRSIVTKNLVVQGGFLTNYFCPLYGLCAILVIQTYTICEITINIRFTASLLAMILCTLEITLLEYITGAILDRGFNHKLWDYSKNYMNLHSYICLEFSIMWGFASIILTNFLHPVIEITTMMIPEGVRYMAASFIFSVLILNSCFNMRKYQHYRIISP